MAMRQRGRASATATQDSRGRDPPSRRLSQLDGIGGVQTASNTRNAVKRRLRARRRGIVATGLLLFLLLLFLLLALGLHTTVEGATTRTLNMVAAAAAATGAMQ
jgi:hypothetical protein